MSFLFNHLLASAKNTTTLLGSGQVCLEILTLWQYMTLKHLPMICDLTFPSCHPPSLSPSAVFTHFPCCNTVDLTKAIKFSTVLTCTEAIALRITLLVHHVHYTTSPLRITNSHIQVGFFLHKSASVKVCLLRKQCMWKVPRCNSQYRTVQFSFCIWVCKLIEMTLKKGGKLVHFLSNHKKYN